MIIKTPNLDVDFLKLWKILPSREYNQLGYQKVEDSSKLSVKNLYFVFVIFS
jgi:hypothetical protein